MTEIRDCPRELLALAVGMREDWDRDRMWAAIHAAHAAGWPFLKTVREIVRLAAIEDSTSNDLRIIAGETRLPGPAEHTPEEVADLKAQALAAAADATERLRQQGRARVTGEQPVLRDNDRGDGTAA